MFLFKVNETLVSLSYGIINLWLNFEPSGTCSQICKFDMKNNQNKKMSDFHMKILHEK